MSQYLNSMFGKNKALQQGDVEFWHGAERAGWLEKQGASNKENFCQIGDEGKARLGLCVALHRAKARLQSELVYTAESMLDKCRWFVLKQGKIFWFKSDSVSPESQPRGVIEVNRCLSIKGAEDVLNKPHAFEISTIDNNMFFIADSDKDKEDWINAVGRAIVRHSKSMLEHDHGDYTTT